MNLPAAIEDTSGVGLPQSLIDKSEEMISKGGVAAIEIMINELPELVQRNQQILDEVRRWYLILIYYYNV